MISPHANDQRAFRRAVENEVERLLTILDAMDPDPDLEEGADAEPWLGWADRHGQGCPPDHAYLFAKSLGQPIADDDREEENENGGDVQDEPHDEEPDLEWDHGWANPMPENHVRQGIYPSQGPKP